MPYLMLAAVGSLMRASTSTPASFAAVMVAARELSY